MAQIIRELTIDVTQTNNLRAITAKQNDLNSRFLQIHITDGGTPLQVDQHAVVTMNVKRTDNAVRPFYGSVNDDGSITVPLTSWMLELAGSINCDISIMSPDDNQRLTTMQFSIYVEAAVFPESFVEESDESDVFMELLKATEVVEECKEVTEEAKDATDAAQKAADGVIIKERNQNSYLTFWVGTKAEYDAIEEKDMGCFYIISDDSDLADLQAQIAAVENTVKIYHTPYDISQAVVPVYSGDSYTLTKCGNTLELVYNMRVRANTNGEWQSISGKIATISGYAPMSTMCVVGVSSGLKDPGYNTTDNYAVDVTISPSNEGKDTTISLSRNWAWRSYGENEVALRFKVSFICR